MTKSEIILKWSIECGLKIEAFANSLEFTPADELDPLTEEERVLHESLYDPVFIQEVNDAVRHHRDERSNEEIDAGIEGVIYIQGEDEI